MTDLKRNAHHLIPSLWDKAKLQKKITKENVVKEEEENYNPRIFVRMK